LYPDSRITGRQFLEQFPRFIFAAIVGDDDFIRQFERVDGFTDGGDQRTQVALLIVAGDHEAELDAAVCHGAAYFFV